MPGKHVWSWWGKAQGQWRAVQQAHAMAQQKLRDVAAIQAEDASIRADEDFLAALTFASSAPAEASAGIRFRPATLPQIA